MSGKAGRTPPQAHLRDHEDVAQDAGPREGCSEIQQLSPPCGVASAADPGCRASRRPGRPGNARRALGFRPVIGPSRTPRRLSAASVWEARNTLKSKTVQRKRLRAGERSPRGAFLKSACHWWHSATWFQNLNSFTVSLMST